MLSEMGVETLDLDFGRGKVLAVELVFELLEI